MVMGPWLHGRRSQTHAGQADFGPESVLDGAIAPDYATLRRQWFDRWLKPAPPVAPAPVRWFRMGGGSGAKDAAGRRQVGGAWREAADWPPPGHDTLALHLGADGTLAEAVPPAATLSIRVDPADPAPSIGGAITSGAPVMEGGGFDQRTSPAVFSAKPPFLPVAARADVLVFATPPLEQDVEIAGPVAVRLWVSTDAPDTDVVIRLVDWAPPCPDWPQGFAMNLTDGILRLRYRRDRSAPEPMRPGEIAEVTVAATPVAALFRKGHRIRLDVAGAHFPRFDVNPQTLEAEGCARLRRVAVNTFHLGEGHPASLLLTVVP
jgi:putative CocE/NonD family hydrolase